MEEVQTDQSDDLLDYCMDGAVQPYRPRTREPSYLLGQIYLLVSFVLSSFDQAQVLWWPIVVYNTFVKCSNLNSSESILVFALNYTSQDTICIMKLPL